MGNGKIRAAIADAVLLGLAGAAIWGLLSAPTEAGEPYIGMNLTSYHVNAQRDFNEENLGALVGVRFGERFQYGGEVGFYNNSYSEISRYGLAFADYPVGPIRLGIWAGAFEYPNLIPWAERAGIPHTGDFLAVAGVHVKSGVFTIRALPGGNKSDLILTLSASVPFGGK